MDGFAKIVFPLSPDEEGYPPFCDETMWAEPLASGLHRVDNIPFFVRGLAYGDEVETALVDGAPTFVRVVRWRGHRTVRLLVRSRATTQAIRDELRALGCRSELHSDGILVAVDVPPAVPADTIRAFLDAGVSADRFEYEEGAIDW